MTVRTRRPLADIDRDIAAQRVNLRAAWAETNENRLKICRRILDSLLDEWLAAKETP